MPKVLLNGKTTAYVMGNWPSFTVGVDHIVPFFWSVFRRRLKKMNLAAMSNLGSSYFVHPIHFSVFTSAVIL